VRGERGSKKDLSTCKEEKKDRQKGGRKLLARASRLSLARTTREKGRGERYSKKEEVDRGSKRH